MARGRWTPLAMALLCAHCSLSLVLPLLALALGGGGLLLFGVDINYVWPPVFILGSFAWYVWSGRRAARADAACEVPGHTPR